MNRSTLCLYNSKFSENKIIKFEKCVLVDDGIERKDNLWVRNGKFIDGHDVFYKQRVLPDVVINCEGAMISPGFIDIQINGGFGIDLSDPQEDIGQAVKGLAQELVQHGVTAFCPTVISSSPDTYHKILPNIQRTPSSPENGAAILGAHLEGPFISKSKKGAHNADLLKQFDNGIESLDEVYGPALNQARIITVAPELPNSAAVINELRYKRGIHVAIGHSIANLEQAEDAINSGANMITHLFNAMQSFHHRDPHIVGLLTSDKIRRDVFFGIIADGIHTHPSATRIAWRVLPEGLILITDAMAALGLGQGRYKLGSLNVSVVDAPQRRAVLTNDDGTPGSTLAGSIVSMPECVWNLSRHARCPLAAALKSATRTPAEALGIAAGRLQAGADADFVMLNQSGKGLEVKATFTHGQLAYLNESNSLRLTEK